MSMKLETTKKIYTNKTKTHITLIGTFNNLDGKNPNISKKYFIHTIQLKNPSAELDESKIKKYMEHLERDLQFYKSEYSTSDKRTFDALLEKLTNGLEEVK